MYVQQLNLTAFVSGTDYYTIVDSKWSTLGSLISDMSSNIWTFITHTTLDYNVIPDGYGITNAIKVMLKRAESKTIDSIYNLKYIEFVVVLLYFISNEVDIDNVRKSSIHYKTLADKLNKAYQDAIEFRSLYFYFLEYVDANSNTYYFSTNNTKLTKSESTGANNVIYTKHITFKKIGG